ncbi:MAG: hypothetical protein ACKOQ1_03150 [Actinomycetota bacterium]
MMSRIRSFIASLRDDATDPYQRLVPDGVLDMSDVVNPLVGIASTGRVVNEFEEYSLGRYLGNLLQRVLPSSKPTKKDLENAVLSLAVVHVATLRETVAIKPDLSIDEILSGALSDEKIRGLQDEFKVVPVTISRDGTARPLLGIMRIFSSPIPKTVQSILGPAIRKMGKLEFYIRNELGDFHPDTGEDPEDDLDAEWTAEGDWDDNDAADEDE